MLSMFVCLCFCRLTSTFQSELSLPFQTLPLPALVEDPEECLQKGPGAGLQVKFHLVYLRPQHTAPCRPQPSHCRPDFTAEGSRHRVGILGAVAPCLGGGTTGPEPQGNWLERSALFWLADPWEAQGVSKLGGEGLRGEERAQVL